MTTWVLLIYVGISLVFGGIAATIETWWKPSTNSRLPPPNPIGMGVFVAVLWPLLLVPVLLDALTTRKS